MKQERLLAVLVDVKRNMHGIVAVPNELEAFYQVLGCDCIDITVRRIGVEKKKVEIICDDESLFREPVKISAINKLGEGQLAGNLLIVGPADYDGNLTSLSMEDALYIFGKVQLLQTRKYKDPYPILTECDYM